MRSAMLCSLALAGLAACASNYDPYQSSNPPNPDPSPSTTLPPQGAVQGAVIGAPVAPGGAAPATIVVLPTAPAYRPGSGVVQTVQMIQAVPAVPSASAGSSAAPAAPAAAYRLSIRMDDGSTQTVDQSSPSFRSGDRVQLTPDARIIILG